MNRIGLAFLVVLGLASPAWATTYYISPTGAGAQNGTSEATAWKTWSAAFAGSTCGDTLIVMDGTYTTATNGDPDLNARVCTTGNVFTIQAQNQRAALIQGNGASFAFRVRSSAHIVVDGLRIKSADNCSASPCSNSGDSTVRVNSSNYVTLKNNIVSHNNRYSNTHVVQLSSSTNSLIEGNEILSFQRHGVFLSGSANNVIRRNYCNDRAYPAITGGYSSGAGGDDCYVLYTGTGNNNNIFENNIAEGGALSKGYAVIAQASIADNKFYGNIAFGTITQGQSIEGRGTTTSTTPQNTLIRDFVSVGATSSGLEIRGGQGTRCDQCSVIDSLDEGFRVDKGQTGQEGATPRSFYSTGLLAYSNVGTGYSHDTTDVPTWTNATSNANSNGTNWSPSSHANYDPDTPSSAAPGMASCYLWAPDASAAQTNNWGATILYRYENGVLGTTTLWDPTTGEFPHGAIVTGVNDIDGSSLYNVHERLHVGVANGCAFPASYPGGTPPQDPTNYVTSEGTTSGTSHSHTFAGGGVTDIALVVVALRSNTANVGSVSAVTGCASEPYALQKRQVSSGNWRAVEVWYKLAPTTGACTITVTTTGLVHRIITTSVALDDVSAINADAGAGGTSATPSVTVVTNPDEFILSGFTSDLVTFTAGADQTVQTDTSHTTGSLRLATSTQSGADGGVMSAVLGDTTYWALVAVSLAPSVPDPPVTPCTLTQVAGQVDSAFLVGGAVVHLGAVNAANVAVDNGTSFAVTLQTDATAEACATMGRKLYVSYDSGAYAPMLDTMTNGLSFFGSTADPLVVSGAVSTNLSGVLTNVPGTTIHSASVTPFATMTEDDSLVNRWVLKLDPTAVGTHTFEFREYTDAGVALDAYGATADAKITVTGVTPVISAPANLKVSGMVSATTVTLIWAPVSYATFAGYKVYQSTTSGVYGTAVASITPASAALTSLPATQWSRQIPVADTYYFKVSAFDLDGNESALSSEVSVTIAGQVQRSPR